MISRTPGLHTLARLHGIQTWYRDANGDRQETSVDALVSVLRAFGAPLRTEADVPSALRERRLALWERVLPSATVVWEGASGLLDLRLAASVAGQKVTGMLALEEGQSLAVEWNLPALTPSSTQEVEGRRFLLFRLPLPGNLPVGYHRLSLDLKGDRGDTEASAMIIAAPARCAAGPERGWGLFLPLYALRTAHDWGIGDYMALDELSDWASGLGAATVGTLPLLPTFLDGLVEPSPYAPISRVAWNPVFIDVTRLPVDGGSREVPRIDGLPQARTEIEELRRLPLVDYQRVMGLKRRVLEQMSSAPVMRGTLRRFAATHRVLDAYARFMATREQEGKPWVEWPERQRCGTLEPGDFTQDAWAYHLYSQMEAMAQMEALTGAGGSAELYLDYPVGVHPHGFDVWREQESLVTDVTVGAPPDSFFTQGQDWGFNPLHPERCGDHSYLVAGLRHHMRYASLLRVDHVMGLHRLYWVPRGHGPTDGAYVRYPAEEMYAVLAIESRRHGTGVVGEDLGTVPPAVPRAMARHGLKRMVVLQFSIGPGRSKPLGWPFQATVASVDTHDTPTFAGYWHGLDIDDRRHSGLLDEGGVRREKVEREGAKEALMAWLRAQGDLPEGERNPHTVMAATYGALAKSDADLVLVNAEDLWLEPEPQNVPGTSVERPNWRRKARYTLEEIISQASVRHILAEVTRLRRRNGDG